MPKWGFEGTFSQKDGVGGGGGSIKKINTEYLAFTLIFPWQKSLKFCKIFNKVKAKCRNENSLAEMKINRFGFLKW